MDPCSWKGEQGPIRGFQGIAELIGKLYPA